MELNSVLAEMGITNEAQDSEVAKAADAEGTSGTTGNYSDAEKTLTASADNKLFFGGGDPPVKKSDLYIVPVVGPALESGDKLQAGDYMGAAASFGVALAELLTFGAAAEMRMAATIIETTATKGGSSLIAKGLGSTGRTTAANLVEQMAMKDAMTNPQLGTRIMEGMKDSRWPGWTKMEYKVKTENGVNAVVHYVGKWEDGILKAVDDFKFK